MNILVVCYFGKNRSKYLANYLEKKGYTVKFGGIVEETNNRITQGSVDSANVIIFVETRVEKSFLKRYKLGQQRAIVLDVDDRVEILAPDKKEVTPEEWAQLQEKMVYPELERQIEKYLPLI